MLSVYASRQEATNDKPRTLRYGAPPRRRPRRSREQRLGGALRRGPTASFDILSAETSPGTRGRVYVHEAEEEPVGGFASVEFRRWNRLGQVHGLAVDPRLKRQGIASALVARAEEFVQREDGRGLYADTPVTNGIARAFYEALGYRRAYVMPQYYGEGLEASPISKSSRNEPFGAPAG